MRMEGAGPERAAIEVEANQNLPPVEGGQCTKHCHRGVEKEPERVAVGFGGPWRAAADDAGRAGPVTPAVTRREASGCRKGLREATSSLAVHPQLLPRPLCLPGALGGHARGGWPTASTSSCCRDRRELALIEPLLNLPQSPGH